MAVIGLAAVTAIGYLTYKTLTSWRGGTADDVENQTIVFGEEFHSNQAIDPNDLPKGSTVYYYIAADNVYHVRYTPKGPFTTINKAGFLELAGHPDVKLVNVAY